MRKYLIVIVTILSFSKGFSQDRFEVKSIGFSINVPENWIPMENEAILKNLNQYDFTEKQMAELLKSNNSAVDLATYTKYDPKKYRGIIPTIKIRTHINQTNNINDFKAVIEKSTENVKKALTNFRFINQPVITEIAKQKAVQFSAQFTLKNGGIDYEIISSTYYIPKKGCFISLNFIEELGKEDNQLLFEELIKSLQLTN
ncbi:hypothetical protein [Flavobacterium sp.]|uniref:hypothetical protein n=1 Tax=Flavobacterium sp. TaxID=239 RepID=UPI00286BBA97|nr:hypothetical protein [Flavobacterium sp.]